MGSRSQSVTQHFTGNISAEDSVNKNKVGHNSTRGIPRNTELCRGGYFLLPYRE